MPTRKPDAAESNAGDDFHIVWTVRKALGLLNFNDDGLKKLSLEGMTSSDNAIVDQEGDVMLGVDLTEYYGGEDFNSAISVKVSQLKYSTRRKHLNWTVSRICQGKKKRYEGSIVHRLAYFFTKLTSTYGQTDVLKKLTLKLVSNRAADPELLSVTTKAQSVFNAQNSGKSLSKLKKLFSQREFTLLDKMHKASGLKGAAFASFIKVLNFDDCNSGARIDHKLESLRAISELGSLEAMNEFNNLRGAIWDKMMPDPSIINDITITDILYEFHCTDIRDLFPVPDKIDRSQVVVERNQLPEIVRAVNNNSNRVICLHGGAGVGKSTIVSSLPEYFDPNDNVVTFDCYGGGVYLTPEDKRHKHSNGILQIVNELSLQLDGPLLLMRKEDSDFYIRELKRRLELYCKLKQQSHPGSKIILIIDAADNSIVAAEQERSKTFVNDLLQMNLPDYCRLIVTCRTERKSFLSLPAIYHDIAISEFSEEETKQFLASREVPASNSQVQKFRKLTYSVPRVMSNVLELPGTSLDDKMKFLKPHGKTLEDIFRLRIAEAERRSGDKARMKKFLTFLITLPRPVPIDYLEEITGLNRLALDDYKIDLWNSIQFDGQGFLLKDEDFETFLRREYLPTKKDVEKIADLFCEKAGNSEYAAIHLGRALYQAGRKSQLQEIVIEEKLLDHLVDVVRKKETFVERARFAMLMAGGDKNNLNFLKLLAVTAEAAKTNRILEETILNKAELSVAYGNLETVQKIYFQQGNPEWFGPVHLRSAAFFSRSSNTKELARQHLEKADKWLSYRQKLPKSERQNYRISSEDIAYGAEAILRIAGKNNCERWIRSWTSKTFMYEITKDLFVIVVGNSSAGEIRKWFGEGNNGIIEDLLLIRACFESGLKAPVAKDRVKILIHKVKKLKIAIQSELLETIICLCEYALWEGVAPSEVYTLLQSCPSKRPVHIPSFYDHQYDQLSREKIDFDIEFRKSTLLALIEGSSLSLSDFYPDTLKSAIADDKHSDKQRLAEEKRRFDQLYRHTVPLYEIRAKFILRTEASGVLVNLLKKVVNAIDNDYDFYQRRRHEQKYIYNFLSLKLADTLLLSKSKKILSILRSGFTVHNELNIVMPLALAKKLSRNKALFPLVLQLLKEAEDLLENNIIDGEEKINYYTESANTASRLSDETGKYYFDRMVECASEIDIGAHDQIRCLHAITKGETGFNSPRLAFEAARFIEFCYEHLRGYEHFPWSDGFHSVMKLDVASSYAILCRWDHRNVRNLSDHFSDLLTESLQQGFIRPTIAAALYPVTKRFWLLGGLLEEISKKFDESGDRSTKNIFFKRFIYDLKVQYAIDHRADLLDEIATVINQAKYISAETVSDYNEFHKRILDLRGSKKQHDADRSTRKRRKTDNSFYRKAAKSVDITKSGEIEKYFSKLKKANDNGWVDDELAMACLRQKVRTGQEVAFIEAVINISPNVLDFYSFKLFLIEVFNELDRLPAVKKWKKNNFARLVSSRLDQFIPYEHFSLHNYREWAAVFEVTENELAKATIEILPDHLENLSSGVLYQLVDILLVGLESKEKSSLIEWLLKRWNANIKNDFADGPYERRLSPTGDSTAIIGKFLRFNIGHPDKRLRWRACHSLRQFAILGDQKIIAYLLKHQNDINNHPFQHTAFPFYWISAKLFLAVAIDRISQERPAILYPFGNSLVGELKSSDLPHAQIRHFLKSACVKLGMANPKLFRQAAWKSVNEALISTMDTSTGKREVATGLARRELKTKFRFDTTDTIPYWYDNLGRVFGVSGYTIARMGERYISEYWGYKGDVYKDNHVHSDNDYYLSTNDHGSEPTIETLRTYYEYHAMFCVACELLKSKPMIENDSDYGTWQYWMRKWSLTRDPFWLADFRDPVAAIEKAWRSKPNDINWEWAVTMNDFHQTVGLRDKYFPDHLVVYQESTIYYGKDYESSSVRSALVNIETAPSLSIALQTAPRYEYHIPFEKEMDIDEDEENTEAAETTGIDDLFQMEGYIKDFDIEREGIDKKDAMAGRIDRDRILLGEKIIEFGDLVYSPDFRNTFEKGKPESPVSMFEVWNDIPKEVSYRDSASGGCRLHLKKKFLLSFLKSINKCLVLKCEICRRPDSRDYSKDYSYYTLIYLVYPDGKIKTIAGNYQLR